MYVVTLAIKDAGIRETFEELVANYQAKLDCVTGLHNAVAQDDAIAEQQFQQELSKAAEEGQRFARMMIERLRPYYAPDIFAAIIKKRGKEAAELMKSD